MWLEKELYVDKLTIENVFLRYEHKRCFCEKSPPCTEYFCEIFATFTNIYISKYVKD